MNIKVAPPSYYISVCGLLWKSLDTPVLDAETFRLLLTLTLRAQIIPYKHFQSTQARLILKD